MSPGKACDSNALMIEIDENELTLKFLCLTPLLASLHHAIFSPKYGSYIPKVKDKIYFWTWWKNYNVSFLIVCRRVWNDTKSEIFPFILKIAFKCFHIQIS